MRRRRFVHHLALCGILLGLFGCGGETGSPSRPVDMGAVLEPDGARPSTDLIDAGVTADLGTDMAAPPRGPSMIQRIQQGDIGEGTSVMLADVVVVSRGGAEGFFVSDGSTSPYSGIYVYHPNARSLNLNIGDSITFVGLVKEYFDLTEIVMNADAEVVVNGQADVPMPVPLSMEDLCDPETAEPWEGMLVSVDNVTVSEVAVFGGFTFTGREGGCSIPANPQIGPIDIGNLFFGQTISRVSGLLHYAFESFQLLPRDDADIITAPLATGVVSIPSVRTGEVPMQSRVTFQGVSVIGVDDFFVYVADPAGGANSGFRITDQARSIAFSVGDKIDVDLLILTAETGRLIQARIAGVSDMPQPFQVTRDEFNAPEFLYTLVQLNLLTVIKPEPSIEFVEDESGTQVYGDMNAAFEINGATVSKAFFEPSFPYLRAGDLFDNLTGVRLTHRFAVIEDGVVAEREVPSIAPRDASDFENYRPTCDARLCVGDLEPGDLVITEIFYDGSCEWIEVKNMRADAIDLTNIRLGERNPERRADRPWIFKNAVIEGDSLAVVGCLPDCAENAQHIFSDLGGPLGNDGDVIELWAADLNLDSVMYQPRRTPGIQLDPGTVEGHPGIEIMTTNDNPAYWCDAIPLSTCGVGGTPGEVNTCGLSCQPKRCAGDIQEGDLLITELMVDPINGDSDCEWIELFNTTAQIIELRGLLVVDGANPNLYRSPNLLDGTVAPGAHVVIMNDEQNCDAPCQPEAVASWNQHASLNNSGDTITLASGDNIIDQATYTQPPIDGISLQRQIDGDLWCPSVLVSPQCAQEYATPMAPTQCE